MRVPDAPSAGAGLRVRKIAIRNFRGIQSLDWVIPEPMVCLVGAGDSRKTTILDALYLALSPHRYEVFDDNDFYDGTADSPISIEVVVGNPPSDLIKDSKFGKFLRGWSDNGELHDEPEETDHRVLSVRLFVDESLEPTWHVVDGRHTEGQLIAAKDRELLGVLRCGEYADRDLSWGRGSVLSRMTGSPEIQAGVFAGASRAARKALDPADVDDLVRIASEAHRIARSAGVSSRSVFAPKLDVAAVQIRSGGIALHDGHVPVRRSGLGSRRLLTMMLQREFALEGGILLLDEIEYGLEPFRIRWLLQRLNAGSLAPGGSAQVILTTHSPAAVVEMKSESLCVVSCTNGVVIVRQVPVELQATVRSHSEAFLGRRVVVCEGQTELGVIRAMDYWWSSAKGLAPFALTGTVPTAGRDGGGSHSPLHANQFRELGVAVAYLGDSDRAITPTADELRAVGVTVFLWDGACATEQRVALDLPWAGVMELVHLAAKLKKVELASIADAVRQQVAGHPQLDVSPDRWPEVAADETLRRAIGVAANVGGWFKGETKGKHLGTLIAKYIDDIATTPLGLTLGKLRTWVDTPS
jgi:hypothetical protein